MNKMNVSRNVISEDYKFGSKRKKNWEEYCETSYRELNSILDLWQDPNYSARPLTRSYYIKVFDCSLCNFTGYASEEALKNKLNGKKVVYDHCLSPQFVTRMILDNPEIYLKDYNNFKQIFWDCCSTIMVTQEENIRLSRLTENDGYYYKIHVPTHLKYNHLGINLYFRPTLKGKWKDAVPLETNIIEVPKNLIEYEKYFLV
jgi:hypothetical protein